MKLFVGAAQVRGRIERYPFRLAELPFAPSLPKAKVLRVLRAARADVAFSVRTPPAFVTGATAPELERLKKALVTLAADFAVITTGPQLGPTRQNRARLEALAEELRASTRRIAWEPRGIFEPAEAEDWAAGMGACLVRDLSREAPPPGPVVYTRLRALGGSGRITQHAFETLIEGLGGCEEAFIVVEGDGAKRVQRDLLEAFGEEGSAEEELDDGTDAEGRSDPFASFSAEGDDDELEEPS